MSFAASPLDPQAIAAIRERYPECQEKLPEESKKYWSEEDVVRFLESGGRARPSSTFRPDAVTCPLLTRARVRLAEQRIDKPAAEYLSFCRFFSKVSGVRRGRGSSESEVWRLPGVSEFSEVEQASSCPAALRQPLRIHRPRDWKARLWNMDFWKRECGKDRWRCHARFPAFEDDERGPDTLAIEATVSEYVDYVRLLQREDRACSEESAMAYPRVGLAAWPPFVYRLQDLFESCCGSLGPPGLEDCTLRWAQSFAQMCQHMSWLDVYGSLFQVAIGATGAITRLHTENAGAHLWLNQIEGRRLFYLFPPQEASNLYAVTGGPVKGAAAFASKVSLVDPFAPSASRQPCFSNAKASCAVLYLGQTLVIPSGWWWYSVALEPSVTLQHPFWSMQNRSMFAEGLRQHVEPLATSREQRERLREALTSIHGHVMDDVGED